MARLVKRFFGKKRGSRNTRSDRIGGAWWAAFSALFLLTGCLILFRLLSQVMIPEWRANNQYRETQGRVIDKRLQEKETEEGDHVYRPQLLVQYEVAGERYERWTYDAAQMFTSHRQESQNVLDRIQVAERYRCWYDPLDPDEVVIVRGYSWHAWLFLVLPVPLIAIGGAGLVYAWINWGRSLEERALRTARAGQLPLVDESTLHNRFPFVPRLDDHTNSAGTTLAFRLPGRTTGWSIVGLSISTALCFGITVIFATMSINGFQSGTPDWFITLLSLLCLAGAIALSVSTVRRCLISTGVGPTLIEINQHPLYPGEEFELFVRQPGRLKMNRLRVLLICEEESHFRQGTNLQIATERVYQSELFCRENFEIQPEQPFETRLKLLIPGGAMHSFDCDHNKIEWRIVIDGDTARLPAFERGYPVIVHPRPERSGV